MFLVSPKGYFLKLIDYSYEELLIQFLWCIMYGESCKMAITIATTVDITTFQIGVDFIKNLQLYNGRYNGLRVVTGGIGIAILYHVVIVTNGYPCRVGIGKLINIEMEEIQAFRQSCHNVRSSTPYVTIVVYHVVKRNDSSCGC